MSSTNSHNINIMVDQPCTERCRSLQHGKEIWTIGSKVGDEKEILALWNQTCLNYGEVKDSFGRNLLQCCASFGHIKLAEWLIKQKGSNVNGKDFVSGYTSLHRAMLYGNIDVARLLISQNANLAAMDNEGFSPLSIWHCDRNNFRPGERSIKNLLKSDPTDLSIFGTNDNYVLGDRASKAVAESMDFFKNQNIKQVALSTYHSAFVAQNGLVWTCGRGNSGQTGQGNENALLQPKKVSFKETCLEVAVGPNHTIFLMENQSVKSCGLNEFAVLGYVSEPPFKQLTPKFISLDKKHLVIGTCTSFYHTIVITKQCLFSFGTNIGQLGNNIKLGEQKWTPSFINLPIVNNEFIEKVSCNEVATAILTTGTDVILFYKNETKKFNLKKKPLKVSFVPIFEPQAILKKILKNENELNDLLLCMFILFEDGSIVIWRESQMTEKEKAESNKISKIDGIFTKVIYGLGRNLKMVDFTISRNCVLFVNDYGEAFRCDSWSQNKAILSKNIFLEKACKKVTDWGVVVKKAKDSVFSDIKFEHLKIKRIPNIYDGLQISSDPKGNNFAIIQMHPKNEFFEVPTLKPSTMFENLRILLDEAPFYDLEFEVGLERFRAHRFIVSSRGPKLLELGKKSKEIPLQIKIDQKEIHPKIFKSILKYIYNPFDCDLLIKNRFLADEDKDYSANKLSEYIKMAHEYTKKMNLTDLRDKIRRCWYVDGRLDLTCPGSNLIRREPIQFSRTAHADMYDIILRAQDKEHLQIPCHRSLLIARLEYFSMMLNSNTWLETNSNEPVNLPVSSKALEVLVDYIYSDKVSEFLLKNATFEFLAEVLAISDQFLIEGLQAMAEIELSSLIQMKNVIDIIQLAFIYNAKQLKVACMHFITLNLGFILENRLLDQISKELMKDLTNYYKSFIGPVRNRRLRQCADIPEDEVYKNSLSTLEQEHPELLALFDSIEDSDQIVHTKKSHKSIRIRGKRTLSTGETDEKNSEEFRDLQNSFTDVKLLPNFVTPPQSPPVLQPPGPPRSMSSSPNDMKITITIKPTSRPFVPLPQNDLKLKEEKEFPGLDFKNLTASASSPPKLPAAAAVKGLFDLPEEMSKELSHNKSGGGGKKKIKWKALNNVEKEPASSQQPQLVQSPPSRDPKNPWSIKSPNSISTSNQVKVGGSPSSAHYNNNKNNNSHHNKSFDEIQSEERKKKDNTLKILSKSLIDKQNEDKAMDELRKFYTNDRVLKGIEILKVERIGSESSEYAAPVWGK